MVIGGEDTGEPNTINSNARSGIFVTGADGAEIIGNVIEINETASDGFPIFGITGNTSHGIELNSNVIDGDQGGSVTRTDKRGITLDDCSGNKSAVVCNTLNAVEIGLQFLSDNNPMTTGDNTFNEMDHGFTLGEEAVTSGLLNKQDYNNDYTSGNNFLGSDGNGHFGTNSGGWNGYALYAYEYTGPFITYEAFGDAGHEYCDIYPYTSLTTFSSENLGKNSSSGFQLSGAVNDGYTECIGCSDINGFLLVPGGSDLETDLSIIESETSFPASKQLCYEWVTKFNLFAKLSEDETYRRSNSMLENFYDTMFTHNPRLAQASACAFH